MMFKFKELNINTTESLPKSMNKHITSNNADVCSSKINKIIGDSETGYLYGNVKIYKSR